MDGRRARGLDSTPSRAYPDGPHENGGHPMRRFLAGPGSLVALLVLVAPGSAAPAPAARGAASVATSALLALAPDRAAIALSTQQTPTAAIYTITATATGSGSISPSGAQKALPGTDKTFTMTAMPCAFLD